MTRWVVLGVGDSNARGLEAAAATAGVPVQLVEWRDWLAGSPALSDALRTPCRLKVEPPR